MRYLLILNIIWLGLMLFFGIAHAESSNGDFVNMEVIKQIESSGNADAYNSKGQAYGWFQITPICLADFNRANNEHYKAVELFNPQINSRVAYWYFEERLPALLRHFKQVDSVDNRIVAYNAGIRAVIRNSRPLETVKYLEKYHNIEKGMKYV